MKYLSTFTGIGGFELGIHKALDDAECIGYSEVDKYAIQTYEEHYKHHNYGDITAINAATLPRFDLIVGGFPCQAFSVAGRRRGFEETRGTLFFDVARILADKRPGHLVLENVKGLLSHDSGKTFATILGVLADLGYRVEWQILNSKHFGVPQSRERVYIIGHLRDRCSRQILPLTGSKQEDIGLSEHESQGPQKFIKTRHLSQNGGLVSDSITIQASEIPHVVQIGQMYDNPHNSQAGRIYDKDGVSPTLDVMGGGNRQPKIIVGQPEYGGGNRTLKYKFTDEVPTIRATQHKAGDNQPKVLEDTQTAYALKASDYKKTATDFVGKSQGPFGIISGRIRKLTPRECERLQGFPDDWTIGSDTQRYKQCGNAVTTNVVEAVMSKLKECLQ